LHASILFVDEFGAIDGEPFKKGCAFR
jgi:hypothetical protein